MLRALSPSFTQQLAPWIIDSAPVFSNPPEPVQDSAPKSMDAYDQGNGMIVYACTLPAGPSAKLQVEQAHDFA